MDTIKIKRGLKQDLPNRLALGEPAFCVDTQEFYVGLGESLPPKAIHDPRITDSILRSVLSLEDRTGDLEISRNELNRICGELVKELEAITNDIYTKTYTDLITQKSPVMNVPSNVVDGGFKDILIKGKTLVNLARTNSLKESVSTSSLYTEDKIAKLKNLKPNTVYTLFFRLNKVTDNAGNYTRADLTLDGTAYLHNITENLKMGHNYVVSTFTLQQHHYTDGFKDIYLRPVSVANNSAPFPSNSKTTYDYNIVLVEGDYSHLNLEYFANVMSVNNPYILNTNGNMFTKTTYIQHMNMNGSNNAKLIAYAKVKKGEDYRVTFQYLKSIATGNHGGVALVLTNCIPWDKINAWYINNMHPGIERVLSLVEMTEVNIDYSFQPVGNEQYVAIYTGIATSPNYEYTATLKNLYLGRTSNTFIEPKYNKIVPSSVINLRSLPDGTCDTYNPITGEHIKRVGEFVLDSNTTYTYRLNQDWGYKYIVICDVNEDVSHLSGLFPTNQYQLVYTDFNQNIIIAHGWNLVEGWSDTSATVGVNGCNHVNKLEFIFKETSGIKTLDQFESWIKNNSITILYPLKTPVVEYVYGGVPQVYKDGYIQVDSDYITPTVEYKLPTNIGSKLDQLHNSVAQLQHFSSNLTEQGTWDVELYSGDTKIALNPSSYGHYYRVGNSVTILGKISVADMSNAPSTGSRYFNIRGIPFSQVGAGATMNFSLVKNLNIETSYQISGYGYSNVIDLLRFNQGSSYSALTPNNVSGGNLEFCFSMTYITN